MIENIMLLIAASVGAWAVGAGAEMAVKAFWDDLREENGNEEI